MANLITEKQKKVIYQEYLFRFIAVVLFFVSILGIFLLAYIVPYYISVAKNDLVVASQFTSAIEAENKENVGESEARIVARTFDELKSVDLYSKNSLLASEYFNKIISHKNSNVHITRLSFNLINKNKGQFLVNGLAKNRDSLVSFIDQLKTDTAFSSIESPISDFAKNSDITFTVNIKVDL
jgi:hypothetical protein